MIRVIMIFQLCTLALGAILLGLFMNRLNPASPITSANVQALMGNTAALTDGIKALKENAENQKIWQKNQDTWQANQKAWNDKYETSFKEFHDFVTSAAKTQQNVAAQATDAANTIKNAPPKQVVVERHTTTHVITQSDLQRQLEAANSRADRAIKRADQWEKYGHKVEKLIPKKRKQQ